MASFGADTLPLVGLFTPAIIFSRVDLPAPFLPIKAIRSFSLMLKVMSLKRTVPLNSTPTASTEIMFAKIRAQR